MQFLSFVDLKVEFELEKLYMRHPKVEMRVVNFFKIRSPLLILVLNITILNFFS